MELDALGGLWITQPLLALVMGTALFGLVGWAHASAAAADDRVAETPGSEVLCEELIRAIHLASASAPRRVAPVQRTPHPGSPSSARTPRG